MLLTIYNSKRDIYGNCYWACKLTHLGTDLSQGTLDANNVQTTRLRELGIEYTTQELPIREFNRLTKGWQYLGCQWEMISERLRLDKHVSEVNEKLASEAKTMPVPDWMKDKEFEYYSSLRAAGIQTAEEQASYMKQMKAIKLTGDE